MRFWLFLFISFYSIFPVTVEIPSDRLENPLPVWVNKGDKVTLKVSGFWTMWDKWANVDYRGHTNFKKVDGRNLGQLLGRIEGGENFEVESGKPFTADRSGLLVLYPNRGSYAHLHSKGEIVVEIIGGKSVSASEAEKLYGWDMSAIDTARNVSWLADDEKDVVLFINKARSNPPLFAELYLYSRRGDSESAREAYDELKKGTPLPPLVPSAGLSRAAGDHAADMGKSGKTGHVGTDGSRMGQRIMRYGTFKGEFTFSENCSYGHNDPLSIVLQLIIDDGVPDRGHRKNIFNTDVNQIGVATRPHAEHRFNSVHDMAKDFIEGGK